MAAPPAAGWGSSLAVRRPGVTLGFAGESLLPGRAPKGKYGLSAANGSPVACVGLAPGPL